MENGQTLDRCHPTTNTWRLVTRPLLTSVTPSTARRSVHSASRSPGPTAGSRPLLARTRRWGHTCAQQRPPCVLKGELGHEVCFSPKGVGTHPLHQQQLGTAATPPLPNSICRKFTNGTSQSRASAREAAAAAALGAPGSATVLFPDLEMQACSPCKLGSLVLTLM